MTTTEFIIAGSAYILFFVVLVALVKIRSKTDGRVEVKLTDAAIAIIPVILLLIVSGKITKLAIGSGGITVETVKEIILGGSQELSKEIEEREGKLKEIREKEVSPEIVFGVVNTFKEFQTALRQGEEAKLKNYFSIDYPNLHDDVKQWSKYLRKELSINVEDVSRFNNEIKASVKINIEGEESEVAVALIEEDNMWKFIK